MISSAFALALAAAAQPAVPLPRARADYAGCLTAHVRRSLDAKRAADQFDSSVQGACADKEAAFRASLVEGDVRNGLPRAGAERNANEEVEEYLLNARDTYREHSEANTRPEA